MERRNSIEPRLRPGETIPYIPEGMVPTRVQGEIIPVPAKTDLDLMYGKSPYTIRQIEFIEAKRVERVLHPEPEQTVFDVIARNEAKGRKTAQML